MSLLLLSKFYVFLFLVFFIKKFLELHILFASYSSTTVHIMHRIQVMTLLGRLLGLLLVFVCIVCTNYYS